MPDWIVWAAFGWMIIAICGRGRSRNGRCGERPALADPVRDRRSLETSPETRAGPARESHRPPATYRERVAAPRRDDLAGAPRRPPTRDEREAWLRRRYVAGEISVEQYEHALDELFRRP